MLFIILLTRRPLLELGHYPTWGLLPLSFRHELYERTKVYDDYSGSWGRHEPDKTGADDLRGHCVEVGYIWHFQMVVVEGAKPHFQWVL